ncbi:hypothetical protein DFH09DRAFT_338744, partial [Mycena vulgaris]
RFCGDSGRPLVLPPRITNIQILQDTWLKVLHTFKTTLGAYQCVTTVQISNLAIDQPFRDTLSSLPLLEDLNLDQCEITGRVGMLLPLRRLTMVGPRVTRSEDALQLVVPETLQHLVLTGSSETKPLLATFTGHILQQLRHIEIRFSSEPHIALFFSVLDACPHLESIHLHDLFENVPDIPKALPQTTIPGLESFTGSASIVGLFVSGRPVVEVELRCSAHGTTIRDTLPALRAISSTSLPLRRLKLSYDIPAKDMLEVFGAITALFPELRELTTQLFDPPHRVFHWDTVSDANSDEDSTTDDRIDNRMVELSDDGTMDYPSSDSSFDSDYESGDEEAPSHPEPTLPGYIYNLSAPPAPLGLDPEPPTDADTPLQ